MRKSLQHIIPALTTLGTISVASAIGPVISFDRNNTVATDDPFTYGAPLFDGNSSTAVFTGVSTDARIDGTMAGRFYGEDEVGNIRWGLLDDSQPFNGGKPGWDIKHGFEPEAVGSTLHSSGSSPVEASYIEFSLTTQEDISFDVESLDIVLDTLSGDANASPFNLWASTSIDGFSSVIEPEYSFTDTAFLVSLNFLAAGNSDAGDDVFLRVYGLIGEDEGTFDVSGINIGDVTVVPEPSTSLLFVGALSALVMRRRRKS